MEAICDILAVSPNGLPRPSTLCQALDCVKMWVWRQLLRRSVQQLLPPGQGSIDATDFEQTSPSDHYR